MTSWDRLPGAVELGTRTQQVSSALPISSAAMRSMSSSVSCVSCSPPPPVPVRRHQDQHGRPREPQDQAQTNPRAHGNNDGPTTQLPASDYTPGSPRPSDHDVSGRPARFSLRTGLRARRRPATTLSMRRSFPAGVHRAGASRTCHPGRYAALPSPHPIHNFRSYLPGKTASSTAVSPR